MSITSLLVMASGLIILGLPAAYFLTGHRIITSPPPVSETVSQRAAPVDQLVSGTGQSGASKVTAPDPTTPEAQPTPASPIHSPVTETASAIPPCDQANGLGLSRIIQIDTSGGPQFGVQHLKGYDFLGDKEVVLTFDDGPWPGSTEAVVKALTDECVKATFFEIGEHASWHPAITKQVIDAGMTVGTHTWSHKDLARNPYANDPEKAEWEIEMGNSAVHGAAAGGNVAPFFRFPDLQTPRRLLSYFAERNIAIFATDIDSRDFAMHKPEQVVNSVMTQLAKQRKGIVLLHDLHHNTAEALPELLRQLKITGYKIVHLVPNEQLTTVAKYDEMFNRRESVSIAQPGHVAAPTNVSATHQRGSMYMYVPTQGVSTHMRKKGAANMGANGSH